MGADSGEQRSHSCPCCGTGSGSRGAECASPQRNESAPSSVEEQGEQQQEIKNKWRAEAPENTHLCLCLLTVNKSPAPREGKAHQWDAKTLMFSEGKTISKIIWSPAEDTVSAGTWHGGSVRVLPVKFPPPAPRGSLARNTLEAFISYLFLLELK